MREDHTEPTFGTASEKQGGELLRHNEADMCGSNRDPLQLWLSFARMFHLPQSTCIMCLKVDAELWRFPDRFTAIGRMIDSYLTGETDTDDAAVHLLFSANRWEKRCALQGFLHLHIRPTQFIHHRHLI